MPKSGLTSRAYFSRIFGQGSLAKRLALRLGWMAPVYEGVVDLLEGDAALRHLLHNVIVAVDIDRTRERRPGLQADRQQTQILVEKVVREDALRHVLGHEAGPTLALSQFERGTAFPDAPDADQTRSAGVLVQWFFGQASLSRAP